MKKKFRILSIVLVFAMIISSISPSSVFATQTPKKYVKSLSLSEKSLILNVGQRGAIFYKVTAKGKVSKKVTAKTSNSNVKVTIQKNKINILARKVGTSKITIYTQGKSIKNQKIKKNIKISITENIDLSEIGEKHETINSYDTFYLEGKRITVPISVSELLNLGFKIDISDDAMLSPKTKSIKTYIYNSKGKRLAKITIVNTGDSDIQIKDGIIDAFIFTGNTDIKLYGDLSFSSTKKQVYNICGEPKFHVYESKDDNYDQNDDPLSLAVGVFRPEQEKNISKSIPTSSYRWCVNHWLTEGRKLNLDKGIYEVKHIYYHFLEITFDNNDNISRIIFAFDPMKNPDDVKEHTIIE